MEPQKFTVVEDHPSPADVEFLNDRINEYNIATTGVDDGRELAIFPRDEVGEIAAGLYGWTWAGWLEVRFLWVRQDRRARGLGQSLLLAAEREAMARGCRYVVLDSYGFQAPGFYLKLGYQVFGRLGDFPAPHGRYYLWKCLTD